MLARKRGTVRGALRPHRRGPSARACGGLARRLKVRAAVVRSSSSGSGAVEADDGPESRGRHESREDGGIGRRAGFRFQWGYSCAGSSPALRTQRKSFAKRGHGSEVDAKIVPRIEGGVCANCPLDRVDAALARALVLAAEAGEWGVVAQLALELEREADAIARRA